jgi:hypothetical protein
MRARQKKRIFLFLFINILHLSVRYVTLRPAPVNPVKK